MGLAPVPQGWLEAERDFTFLGSKDRILGRKKRFHRMLGSPLLETGQYFRARCFMGDGENELEKIPNRRV